MPLKREINALLPILENPANADKSSEEIAAELIDALDDTRATHNRLAVVAQYSIDQGETWHHAVLGPFSTRSQSAARQAAEGFTGRPTQPGQGRFMLVPAYASTRDAWAAIGPSRALALELARARRASGWNPWQPDGPVCRCGVRRTDPRDSGRCPVHPERTS
jgi:hypothetical protein